MLSMPMKPALTAESRQKATERSDAELLACIARHDRAAFTELYDRYCQQAFNLAFNLTENRALAEESLQDAMLAVWQDAGQCETEHARSWILKIVATKSLRNGRQQRAGKQREKRVSERLPAFSADATLPDESEQLAALRGKVGALPHLDRQLIALHFGAGMSQYEISSALSIPRTTIASRIEKVLGLLRQGMAQAGFCAVPLTAIMESALSQRIVSPLLRAKLLSKCGGTPPRRFRSSKRIARASSGSPLVPALVLAAVGCGLILAYAIPHTTPASPVPTRTTEAQAVVPAPVAAPVPLVQTAAKTPQSQSVPATAKPEEFSQCWSFKDAPANGMKIIEGTWSWKRTDLGGVMAVGQPIAVTLPITVPPRPFKVTLKTQATSATVSGRSTLVYKTPTGPAPFETWWTSVVYKSYANRFESHECWCVGRYYFGIVAGRVITIRKFESEYPSRELALVLDNILVQELKIESVQPEDLPSSIRDAEGCIAKMRAETGDKNHMMVR
jgi:RNA polymerase sigma-70 factor (ECF subfamily)